MTKILIGSMIASILCLVSVPSARPQEAQPATANQSWTSTTDTTAPYATSRTVESHVKSDNRAVDTSRVEVLGPNGRYEPNLETEKETIQVDAATTRTIERTYNWDTNGKKNLASVTEEEEQASTDGSSHVVRTISNADGSGYFGVTRQEVSDTTQTSPSTQETKTTLYFPDGNGRLTPSWKTQELQTRTDEHTVDVKKTTLRQYSSGGVWQADEVTESTIKENGNDRTTDERVSRSDLNGKLSEVWRTVDKQAETASGEKTESVDTYSTQVPGLSPDGDMHLTKSVTTVQKDEPGGQTTERQFAETNAFEGYGAPQVVRKTKYIVQYAGSSAQQSKTVELRDLNGNWNVAAFSTGTSHQVPSVVAFGTNSSDQVRAEQARPKPPAQPY